MNGEEDFRRARAKARIAGLCYLGVIAGGIFAEAFVRSAIAVPGDAAATMQAIAANAPMWRAGLAVHLLYLMLTVVVGVILYELLKPHGPALARMALVFTLMCSTVEAATMVQMALPLALIGNQPALTGLGADQLHSLGYLAVRLFATGFSFAILLFSGFCILVGVLILRSRLIARPIGLMMMLAGFCYFADSVLRIVAPQAAAMLFPWLLLPGFLAELSLALWLTIRGVRPLETGSPAAASSPPADSRPT